VPGFFISMRPNQTRSGSLIIGLAILAFFALLMLIDNLFSLGIKQWMEAHK
jgi:hypothetical protein